MTIRDLFAGIGWGCALESLGLSEVGYDLDADVCATRALHGWETVQGDLSVRDPLSLGETDVLIASPPCQSFSSAGKRKGLADDRGQLVWQVPRYALALRPRVLICEQVPPVLPIWRMIGHELDRAGYRWWAGCLDAVTFGVPQTRKRAILIARRDGLSPLPPVPTHRPYRSGVAQSAGDPSLLRWVSMAEALGWGMTARPAMTLAPGTEHGGPDIAGGSGARRTITNERGSGRWMLSEAQAHGAQRPDDTPAMTISASADNGNFQWTERPATTITGDDRVSLPGHHHPTVGHSSQYGPDPIRLTVAQALTLQSFPPDFALAGTKTAAFRQVGNSVAPLFASALLAHVLGLAQPDSGQLFASVP